MLDIMHKDILIALRNELFTRSSLDTLPEEVWTDLSVRNTYGTNAIEGNSLTEAEVRTVIVEAKGVEKPISDIQETIQHKEAFCGLLGRRARAIDHLTALELHEQVFHSLRDDAGQWRRWNVSIGGAHFTPPRVDKLLPALDDLFETYDRRDRAGEDPLDLGAWFHLKFEMVHPFGDGNGRVGRLLLNLHLLKHNWPPVQILPEDRKKYIKALEAGSSGDLAPIAAFVQARVGATLIDLLAKLGTDDDGLRSLAELAKGTEHTGKYLALRASQGQLPATRYKGEYRTSLRAIRLYKELVGRSEAKQ
jgi:Fic family protein